MDIQVETTESGNRTSIKVEGPLTVYESKDLLSRLSEGAGKTNGVSLDVSQVASCDTAGVQVIWSAKRTFADQGKLFEIVGMVQPVLEAMGRCGLEWSPVQPESEE